GVQLFDETLRDGIQSPSVVDPRIDDKLELVRLASDLGIRGIDLGFPGAGPRPAQDVARLATFIRDERLPIRPAAAARTHVDDVPGVLDTARRPGVEIEVLAFIGSSPIRLYTEGWDLDDLRRRSAAAIELGVANGLPVTFVTEDTTRSRPDV